MSHQSENSPSRQQIQFSIRPDLEFAARDRVDEEQVVKDPISLRYFKLRREEAMILQMLDGTVTFEEIKRAYEKQFPLHRLLFDDFCRFLSQAHRNGLIVPRASNSVSATVSSADRQRRNERNRRWSHLFNPLVFRWKGLNPDRALDHCYGYVSWIYSSWMLAIWLLFTILAILLAATHWNRLAHDSVEFYTTFTIQHAFLLLFVFATVKVLHELAHAFTCKRFGGAVHELGVLFVVGTPLLYCNVTDAWMFRSRWQRIAVSAAGVVIEIFIASVATLVWWVTEPGMWNAVSRSTMLVCSVNTLLANANPLLRFDGYFVLSDLVRIPNLWSHSRNVFLDQFVSLTFGSRLSVGRNMTIRRRLFLCTYAMASILYRFAVIAALLWCARAILRQYNAEVLFYLVATLTAIGLVIHPLVFLTSKGKDPMFRRGIRKPRFVGISIALIAIIGIVAFVPFPSRVRSNATIKLHRGKSVYVKTPGRIVTAARPGERVEEGDLIVQLRNDELQLKIAAAESDYQSHVHFYKALIANSARNDSARAEIPRTKEELLRLENRLTYLKDEAARLQVRAPEPGTIFANLRPPESRTQHNLRLPKWQHSPLKNENRGCYLETGTACCSIGTNQSIGATLIVNERSVRLVQPGQSVKLCVPGRLGVLNGKVIAVSQKGIVHSAREITYLHATTVDRPTQTLFEAEVQIDFPDGEAPPIGIGCTASIKVAKQTILERVLRSIRWLANS